jgi:hypothetical protein
LPVDVQRLDYSREESTPLSEHAPTLPENVAVTATQRRRDRVLGE